MVTQQILVLQSRGSTPCGTTIEIIFNIVLVDVANGIITIFDRIPVYKERYKELTEVINKLH